MLYQITLTEEQHDALFRLIERANAKPEKKNDDVRAIASIKVGSVVPVKTQFHFTAKGSCMGTHFNPPFEFVSETFASREECRCCMKATMLERSCEEMSSKEFDSANFVVLGDKMRFTMVFGEDNVSEEYEMHETIADE